MRSVRDIPILHNIPVLVRASLNVPVENGRVVSDYRLRRAIATLEFLAAHGARVIIISHIGEKGTETLEPVAAALGKLISGVSFCKETVGERARGAVRNLLPGKILVLENLRRDRGEKMNNRNFAETLASLGDVFVEDSFDTCHRLHASIVTLPELLPAYAGIVLEEEVVELTRSLSPKSPSLAIIGGAKFNTKEAVLATLLKKYDKVFVGGALANDFLKASGRDVGASLVSNADESAIKKLLENSKLVLPIDSVIENGMILDHGPKTSEILADLVEKAQTVLWNGPLGKYEDGFIDGTNALARAIATSGTRSVIGGGDTVAAIENLGLMSHFSFISTGGGAMLDFLAHGTLPGIEALK